MGNTSLSWSCSLEIDSDNVQSPQAQVTATLYGCSPSATLDGWVALKIGVLYLNAAGTPIGLDGNPLPAGQTHSTYEELARDASAGLSPRVWTATRNGHDGAAYCLAHKPASAKVAKYRYYTVSSGASGCPGATYSNTLGPTSSGWGVINY